MRTPLSLKRVAIRLKNDHLTDGQRVTVIGIIKDYAILLTPAIVLLGITFDVGYFWGLDINIYTLFTLSEHLLFAVEALPFATPAVLIITLTSIYHPNWMASKTKPMIRSLSTRSLSVLYVSIIILLIVANIFIIYMAIYLFTSGSIFWIIYVTMFLMQVLLVKSSEDSYIYLLIQYVLLIATSYSLGQYMVQRYTSSSVKNVAVHNLYLNHESLSVRVIRSGEKGLLVYDNTVGHVKFIRWENIESIELVLPESSSSS